MVLCCWSSALVLTDCMPPPPCPTHPPHCSSRLSDTARGCRGGMTKVGLGMLDLDGRIRHSCERLHSYVMRRDLEQDSRLVANIQEMRTRCTVLWRVCCICRSDVEYARYNTQLRSCNIWSRIRMGSALASREPSMALAARRRSLHL